MDEALNAYWQHAFHWESTKDVERLTSSYLIKWRLVVW